LNQSNRVSDVTEDLDTRS